MNYKITAWTVIAGLALEGCSSRPREFTPTLVAPASDVSIFNADYASCRELFAQGKLDSSGRLASGAAGMAAGASAAALGTAAATSAGLYGGGVAIASATIVLIPFAVVGGAIGMAKRKRHRKEVTAQRAMNGCLAERGHPVAGWAKTPKRAAGDEAIAASVTR